MQRGAVRVSDRVKQAGVALVAATFWPLQHRLRRLLERALFRDVYEYAETLRELSSEIVHFASADAIVARPLAVGREA